jgi:uncharacterized protein involved in high-affinity Fe2+ transport
MFLMLRRWAGPLVAVSILVGVALILVFNLDLRALPLAPGPVAKAPEPGAGLPSGFREYPIGEMVESDARIRVAAVWLPAVAMEEMAGHPPNDSLHLEADVRALEGNRNGFAKDEFVPYLRIRYSIVSMQGGPPIEGELMPMVARDGLHYGASIARPGAGSYVLTYRIQPPSVGGLGRHSDPVTGVAPWWKPFDATFDWEFQGPLPGGSDRGDGGTARP